MRPRAFDALPSAEAADWQPVAQLPSLATPAARPVRAVVRAVVGAAA
jgi:hypothetical protein